MVEQHSLDKRDTSLVRQDAELLKRSKLISVLCVFLWLFEVVLVYLRAPVSSLVLIGVIGVSASLWDYQFIRRMARKRLTDK